ncbi:MarR family winged helix-turn-helix transcriptional regulator [Lentibacillus sediminis]|uniref:MarR family winged helix-turn-helix transcriptional regulator n=1 Tax=Lentibacillus sediminis TaxID=1940529 RepID=UPI001EFD156C|nr:MarR family winged helix-turn-helix transcriptional regulator [Lentibacillus sediminis]
MSSEWKNMNIYWTDIYYHLHYPHQEKITHQVIRILQHVEKRDKVGVNDIASYLKVSQNTASEHIKRVIQKGLLIKNRDTEDERKIILQLTDEGKKVVYRNTSLDENKLDKLFAALTKKEQEQVHDAFQLVSERAKQCML